MAATTSFTPSLSTPPLSRKTKTFGFNLSFNSSSLLSSKTLQPLISHVPTTKNASSSNGGSSLSSAKMVTVPSITASLDFDTSVFKKYEEVKSLGAGSFGEALLMRNKETGELVAVKRIPRGRKIDETVSREIINLRSLRHPNIIGFKEVVLTPEHLGIVMEYAAGGELSQVIEKEGKIREDEARYYFQQLISGVNYCHSMHVCHRDLKLENVLLDGSEKPNLKICDFGLSKSSLLHSRPNSAVGTPAYMAPEVVSRREYDGKLADVWSCGVTLYYMLVGAYPFKDQVHYNAGEYKIPDNVHISQDCRDLLSCIFDAKPAWRITIQGIKNHPWFLENLPMELTEANEAKYYKCGSSTSSLQSVDEIMQIVEKAKFPLQCPDQLDALDQTSHSDG